jgi:hypothetical protein
MALYTLVPVSDAGPNTGNPVPFVSATQHFLNVDDNNSGSGYVELGLNEEEWFGLNASIIPATDTVVGLMVRVGGEDPDFTGDTLQVKIRRNGIEEVVDTIVFDLAGYKDEAFTLPSALTRAQVSQVELGVKCTSVSGGEVRLGYLALEVETTHAAFTNGPIIAGDEDATVM